MSGFIDEADRSQGTLLPEHVDEYVSDENPVRVIEAFIGELDLATLSFEGMEPKPTGRPGYHPATMLKIYLYGYLNRIHQQQTSDSTFSPPIAQAFFKVMASQKNSMR
jgi:transposase